MNWKQPQASVPGYPEIESFLRSDRMFMVHENRTLFRAIADTQKFADEILKVAHSSRFHVTVTAAETDARLSCVIIKEQISSDLVENSQCHVMDFVKLITTKLLMPLVKKSRSVAAASSPSNPKQVLPPSKRPKLD